MTSVGCKMSMVSIKWRAQFLRIMAVLREAWPSALATAEHKSRFAIAKDSNRLALVCISRQ
jgi:hypothetical protein